MTTVRRSLSEIRATATKAARGAGCPWGMAEEAGLAARVLEAHGLDGVGALANLFASTRACACTGHNDAPTCGLSAMTALSDAMPEDMRDMNAVVAPLLLAVPLLLQKDAMWSLDWDGGGVVCGAGGCRAHGETAPAVAEGLRFSRVALRDDMCLADWRSRDVPETAWDTLEILAARTYVPETEASRAAGAGPGSADSD